LGFDRSARDFWVRIAAAVLAVIGIGVTAYLVWERYHGNAPFCAVGGGCLTVQRSEFSTVAGVPVAFLGLVAYVGLLLCALVPRQWAALASLFITILGLMLSAYLTYLELFQIHATCEYCVTSAIVVGLSLLLSIARLGLLARDASAGPPVAA
jgi:uncharacterized membrane protein